MNNDITKLIVGQDAGGDPLLVSIPYSAISKISCQAATHGDSEIVTSFNLSRLPVTLAALSGRSADRYGLLHLPF